MQLWHWQLLLKILREEGVQYRNGENSKYYIQNDRRNNIHYYLKQHHQQKIIPSGRNGSVRVDALSQSRHSHPGGGLHRTRRQFHASCCISPSHRSSLFLLALSVSYVKLTLWRWRPTVTIRRNVFIGHALASELQCDGWHCKNLSSHSFYLRAKCISLFTNYTHHSKLPDLCGYWQSITRSVRLLSYY